MLLHFLVHYLANFGYLSLSLVCYSVLLLLLRELLLACFFYLFLLDYFVQHVIFFTIYYLFCYETKLNCSSSSGKKIVVLLLYCFLAFVLLLVIRTASPFGGGAHDIWRFCTRGAVHRWCIWRACEPRARVCVCVKKPKVYSTEGLDICMYVILSAAFKIFSGKRDSHRLLWYVGIW